MSIRSKLLAAAIAAALSGPALADGIFNPSVVAVTTGSTGIVGGTNTRVLFDDSGTIGESAGLTFIKGNGGTTSNLVIGGNASLFGEASNTLALRNGATAQFFNLYGTFTDASNYDRFQVTKAAGGDITFSAQAAGTGTAGTFIFNRGISMSAGSLVIDLTRAYGWAGGGQLLGNSDGVFMFANNAGSNFGRLQFGGTTSANGALKYSKPALGFRRADDTIGVFADLPAAATGNEGSVYPISDSSTATWGATITGGGANHVLAYSDGTNWTVAAK